MNKATLHGLNYEVPTTFSEIESPSEDTIARYSIEQNRKVMAVLEVVYTEDYDLEYNKEQEHIADASKGISEIIPSNNCVELEDCFDSSCFKVVVYEEKDGVRGTDALVETVIKSFDGNSYTNPRSGEGIIATYTGSTKAGVTIDADSEGILVTEKFNTGVAEGVKTYTDWKIKEPVTLASGETSTVIISVNGQDVSMDVTCSDLSESQFKDSCSNLDYKNQLRASSTGEHIKIYGKVIQDCGNGCFRITSGGSSWDDVYMVVTTSSDIVEDDWVTCYGTTTGIYTYKTVLGASQSIPSMSAKYIDR